MIRTQSGIQYEDYKESGGPPVKSEQTVKVHYTVALDISAFPNGPFIESSWELEPITLALGKGEVLPGIEEGMAGMRIGSMRRILIPPELAFGERGVPDRVPPNTALAFEVYLIEAK